MADILPMPAKAPDPLAELVTVLRERLAPPAALLDRAGTAAYLGLCLVSFDRQRAAGRIGPRPVSLAGPRWEREELATWLRTRDAAGQLFDVEAWAAVWASLQRRKA